MSTLTKPTAWLFALAVCIAALFLPGVAAAQDHGVPGAAVTTQHHGGGEANLVLPRVGEVKFFNEALAGDKLLMVGIVVSVLGMLFGLWIYSQLKNMPVHKTM